MVGSSSRATYCAFLLDDGKDIRNPCERFPGCSVCHGHPPRGHRRTNFCARPLAGSRIRDPERWHVSQQLCRTSSGVKNPESLFSAGLSRALSQQNCLSGPNLNPCVLTSWHSSRPPSCLGTTCLGPAAARGRGTLQKRFLAVGGSFTFCCVFNEQHSEQDTKPSKMIRTIKTLPLLLPPRLTLYFPNVSPARSLFAQREPVTVMPLGFTALSSMSLRHRLSRPQPLCTLALPGAGQHCINMPQTASSCLAAGT